MQEENKPALPETPAEQDIWQGSPADNANAINNTPPSPYIPHPARKPRPWGFVEVILSGIALLCVQVLMLLVMTAGITKDLVEKGADLDDLQFVTDEVTKQVLQGGNLFLILLANYLIWVGFMAYATYAKGLKSFAKDFWFRFKWVNDCLIGLGLALLLRGTEMVVLNGLTASGMDLTGAENTTDIIGQDGIWYFLIAILFASIVGPICEELFFRGFLLQAFLRNFRRGNISGPKTVFGQTVINVATPAFNAFVNFRNWTFRHKYVLAAVLSGVIFGSVHWNGEYTWQALVPIIETGIIGIIFGFIVIKTKRLGITVFAHCFFNLSGVLLATYMQ
jgi:membrane protease YdiL (CAAX protease family)